MNDVRELKRWILDIENEQVEINGCEMVEVEFYYFEESYCNENYGRGVGKIRGVLQECAYHEDSCTGKEGWTILLHSCAYASLVQLYVSHIKSVRFIEDLAE